MKQVKSLCYWLLALKGFTFFLSSVAVHDRRMSVFFSRKLPVKPFLVFLTENIKNVESASLLADREFSAACYLFTHSNSGVIFSHGNFTFTFSRDRNVFSLTLNFDL